MREDTVPSVLGVLTHLFSRLTYEMGQDFLDIQYRDQGIQLPEFLQTVQSVKKEDKVQESVALSAWEVLAHFI